MKIKFTHDFRGKATEEKFYLEGAELDVDEDVANELIALNHAVVVVVERPKPEAPKPRTRKAKPPVKKVDKDGS